MSLVLLIKFELSVFSLLLKLLCLLHELFVISLELLGQKSDLRVFCGDSLVERLRQLLDLVVELVLDLFGLLLLEQDLVFVVDFSLGQSLVALLSHVVQPLLKAHLL